MRTAICAFALFLVAQLGWAQTAASQKSQQAPKSLAEVHEFCNNPIGGGSFDSTRKAAMDEWAADRGFKPISGPCKAKGQWVLTWSEAGVSRYEAVIVTSPSGAPEIRPKRLPGSLVLSRVSDGLTLNPSAEVLFQTAAPTIEEALDKFVESVEQARKPTLQQVAVEQPASNGKAPSTVKPAKAVKRMPAVKNTKTEKQVGG